MLSTSARHAMLAAAFALLALPASADVLVVDDSGGGDFDSLIDAVAAAADGDTLLVRPGNYRVLTATMEVIGRSLVIAADGNGPVLTNPFLIITSAGQRVVLRGLTVESGTFDTTTTGLHTGGSGDILLEGCTILGRDGHPAFANTFGGAAIVCAGSTLVLKDCIVEGGRGSDANANSFVTAMPGGPGIHVLIGHTLAVHGGSVTGGRGGNFVPGMFFPVGPGSSGGTAVLADSDATLLLAGCLVTGGAGGSGNEVPGDFSPSGYAGGDAVRLFSQAELALLDSTLVPGAPGLDGAGQPGFPGDALDVTPTSAIIQHPGSYRSNTFGAPTGEGDELAFHYDGVPGDLVGLFLSLSPASQPPAVKQGLLHLGTPLIGPFVLGPVRGTGTLALNFTVPNLGFGPDDALLVYQQSLVKPAAGESLLSSPTTIVLLDNTL